MRLSTIAAILLIVGFAEVTSKPTQRVAGDATSSVLEIVEQMLAQTGSGSQSSDVASSTAIRDLLQHFEDEITARLREGNPEALATTWNAVIAEIQANLTATNEQLAAAETTIPHLKDTLAKLEALEALHNKHLSEYRDDRARVDATYNKLRQKLQEREQQHILPDIDIATTIKNHIYSIFESVPDASSVITPPSDVKMLELASDVQPTPQTSGGEAHTLRFSMALVLPHERVAMPSSELREQLQARVDQMATQLHIQDTQLVITDTAMDHFHVRENARLATSFESVPVLDVESCAMQCRDNAKCYAFSFENESCALASSRVFPAAEGPNAQSSRVYYLRLNDGPMDNFHKVAPTTAENQTILDECATHCLNHASCLSFDLGEDDESCLLRVNGTGNFVLRRYGRRATISLNIQLMASDPAAMLMCIPITWTSVLNSGEASADYVVTSMKAAYAVLPNGDPAPYSFCTRAGDIIKPPLDDVESTLSSVEALTHFLRLDSDASVPSAGQATVMGELHVPTDIYEGWWHTHESALIRAIADAISPGDQELIQLEAGGNITIVDVIPGTFVVFTFSVNEKEADAVLGRLNDAVANGAIAHSLSEEGLPVAWVAITNVNVNYGCPDVFLPIAGRLECESADKGAATTTTQPCGCAHYAALTDFTHFAFDPRNGSCVVWRPSVGLDALDDWYQNSCKQTFDGDSIHYFSGQLLTPYLNKFALHENQRLSTKHVQHRINEEDANCCARQCTERSWCGSFDWNEEAKLCDLHSASANATVEAAPGVSHFVLAGYDASRALSRTQAEGDLLLLSDALVSALHDVKTYLARVRSAKDAEYLEVTTQLDKEIQRLAGMLTAVSDDKANTIAHLDDLMEKQPYLSLHNATLSEQLHNATSARDEEIAQADENVKAWQEELETIRELRKLLDDLLRLGSHNERERALRWLRNREDLRGSGNLFRPFHDSPTSLYTATGHPRNKIDPDNTRFTGMIPCVGTERSVFYSIMAEANVTYTFQLFENGYTMEDAVLFLREAPSLKIIADHLDTTISPHDTPVGSDNQGIANLEDALPTGKLVWECLESGWYVLQVLSYNPKACGTFGVSVVSSAPPFVLVVDGQEVEGAIACNNDKPTNPATFRFDALSGVTYRVEAFTKSKTFTLPGTVLFVRDPLDSHVYAGSDYNSLHALTDSAVTWTCPHDGVFEVEVTSQSGAQCGTFGIKLETVDACLRNPCPRGTVCQDASEPGEFLCKQANSTFHYAGGSYWWFQYGVSMTVWLDMPHSYAWEDNYGTHFLNAVASLAQLPLAAQNVMLVEAHPESGGVSVKFNVAVDEPKTASSVWQRLTAAIVDGSFATQLQAHSVPAVSVWLLSMDLKDQQPIEGQLSVDAQLTIAGVPITALRSPTGQIPLRVALANSLPGVSTMHVHVNNITTIEAHEAAAQALIQADTLNYVSVDITIILNTTDSGLDLAMALRFADLTSALNHEFEATGLSHRAQRVTVVLTSFDDALRLRNSYEECTQVDGCRGCAEVWRPGFDIWEDISGSESCVWMIDAHMCGRSDPMGGQPAPCRRAIPSNVTLPQVQLLYTLRLSGVSGSDSLRTQVVGAAMWWAKVADPADIAVAKTDDSRLSDGVWSATLIIGVKSRQDAVATLRLLDAAVISGDLLKFLQNKIPVSAVHTTEARLTNSRKTGFEFTLKTDGAAPQSCERVLDDTGGCDAVFRLSQPYANLTGQVLPSPSGNVELPKACDVGDDFADVSFPDGRRGSVIFVDAAHVDVDRSVPHLLETLPQEARPHSAIALAHSAEEWEAALHNKAWFVIPKLRGPLVATLFSANQSRAILNFVAKGGNVIVAGTPVRSVELVNQLFGVNVEDVPPSDGGVSFMPGSNVMTARNAEGFDKCAREWKDQNAFNFVSSSSLPTSSRVLFAVPDSNKVSVFDLVHASAGHVLYFGFDFYDVPSVDTACILRSALALQYA